MVVWASRAAGGLGIVTAVLYLGVLLGVERQSGEIEVFVWFAVMLSVGLLAWFADKFPTETGRKMLWVAGGMFLILGVLSIFSIGLLFLAATVLTGISLVWRAAPESDVEV